MLCICPETNIDQMVTKTNQVHPVRIYKQPIWHVNHKTKQKNVNSVPVCGLLLKWLIIMPVKIQNENKSASTLSYPCWALNGNSMNHKVNCKWAIIWGHSFCLLFTFCVKFLKCLTNYQNIQPLKDIVEDVMCGFILLQLSCQQKSLFCLFYFLCPIFELCNIWKQYLKMPNCSRTQTSISHIGQGIIMSLWLLLHSKPIFIN